MEQLITGGLEKTFGVTGENKKTKVVLIVIWLVISLVFLGILNRMLNDMCSTTYISIGVILFIIIQVIIILQATQI